MSGQTFLEIAIDKKMSEVALSAMMSPKDGLFEYGRVCGIYAGLQMARQLLLDTRKDAEDKENLL